ncbi:hypothetical protein C9374_003842 [Naegleria lovaniensis]|uniref:Phospholipid-transporting ATPase n=1 Tax=Naegleria lovaniensis TaxID=51637 RepID=A0AA88H3Y6_NAELO|nr:uncharacterized protein C9374_003842 [Naegleria lovaniensis]KAG2394078.1 hypothetical protein C9374_003842 [Naegleria lovaniensis]
MLSHSISASTVVQTSISDVSLLSMPREGSSTELLNISEERDVMKEVNEFAQDEHQVRINDWNWNSKQTKKGYLGFKVKRFPSNTVKTTKYTWWNFPVLNLFHQCRRVGTIYFVFQMIISLIPGVVTIPVPLIILPVIFIISVNMIREGGEDFLRYLNDRRVNFRHTYALREGIFCKIHTCDVKVGDIVKVEQDDILPADILLVGSSQEDSSCKIETANLDGESSLKSRYSPKWSQVYNSIESLLNLKGQIKCQKPNEHLYKFSGAIYLENEKQEIPLSHLNLLLKGCKLKTEWIFGLVVYTGEDTKAMKNMNKSIVKFSYVNKMLNVTVGIMFGVQISFCLAYTIAKTYLEFSNPYYYLGTPKSGSESIAVVAIMSFLTYIISFAHFIPVSLLVSFELVKALHAWFISMDNEMAIVERSNDSNVESINKENADSKFISSIAISSDLNCDLSKIDMIFSDKTGTLTENLMVFKKAAIGRDLQVFCDSNNEKGSLGETIESFKNHIPICQEKPLDYTDNGLTERPPMTEEQFFFSIMTLLTMSLCHNVSVRPVKHTRDNGEKTHEVTFEGESVDEVALVLGALNNQFSLVFMSDKKTVLKVFNKEYSFERLSEIPFTPERKRMTTVFKISQEFLKDFPIFERICIGQCEEDICADNDGVIACFTKGADSFLYPLLEQANRQPIQSNIDEQSSTFASEGLRTLLLCYKLLSKETFQEWNIRYNAAKSLVLDTARKQAMDKCEKDLEKDLIFVGCTAIEDILQDEVPSTIKFFMDSGIQIWMLTGDKRETAVKTAGMAGMLNENSVTFTLDGDNGLISGSEVCAKVISEYLAEIAKLSQHQTKNVTLVLDGKAFSHCLDEPLALFKELIKKCTNVIFCRSTPKQKSQLVTFARRELKKRVLAIGDGANDVPMIQKANVGVGVIGKEGNQAKMSSDFAVPKFRMLKRLIAVHGRYSLKRIATFINYYIYMNLGIVFIQVLYSFFTRFSGQALTEDFVVIFTTLFFQQLNPLSFGLFEKDISESYLQDSKVGPKLLSSLRKENVFNLYTFVKWIGGGIIHVIIIFFVCIYGTERSILTNGKDDGLWMKTVLVNSCSFMVMNLKCYLEFEYVTPFHHFAMAFSFATFYGFNLLYAAAETAPLYNIWYSCAQSPVFWFTHLLCLVSTLGIDFTLHHLKELFFPDYYQQLKRK